MEWPVIPQLFSSGSKRGIFKGRETLFEYAVCCFSKKKVSLSPLTPLFPKTLTTKPVYSILVRVKKFGKRGV